MCILAAESSSHGCFSFRGLAGGSLCPVHLLYAWQRAALGRRLSQGLHPLLYAQSTVYMPTKMWQSSMALKYGAKPNKPICTSGSFVSKLPLAHAIYMTLPADEDPGRK